MTCLAVVPPQAMWAATGEELRVNALFELFILAVDQRDELLASPVNLTKIVHQFQVSIFDFSKLLLLVVLETLPIGFHVYSLRLQRLDVLSDIRHVAFIFLIGRRHRGAHPLEVIERSFYLLYLRRQLLNLAICVARLRALFLRQPLD